MINTDIIKIINKKIKMLSFLKLLFHIFTLASHNIIAQ